jgi:hypothetical protein
MKSSLQMFVICRPTVRMLSDSSREISLLAARQQARTSVSRSQD